MCKVIAVCISKKKGEQKKEVDFIECLPNFGIKKDAHSGNWHRQISLLAKSSIDKIKKLGVNINNGDFAENIVTEGIDLKNLLISTKLSIGDKVILEITQIGKKCHSDCIIKEKIGECVMPNEGIFAIVLVGGLIKKGDCIKVINNV